MKALARLRSGPLPIYVTVAIMFAVMAARGLALPLYADQVGANRAQIGLLFTVFTVAGGVLSIPAGVLSDRFGRRQLVLYSILVAGVTQVAAAFTTNVAFLFVLQGVGGVAAGATQTALMASLADSVPIHRMGRAMGWFTLGMQTGFLVGPAVAGILLRWLNLAEDLALTALPLVAAAAFAFIGVHKGHRAQERVRFSAAIQALVRRPGFYAVSIALLAGTMVWGTYQAYIPIFGKRGLGLTGTEIGYLLAIQALSNGLSRVPAGRLLDRIESKGPVVAGSIAVFALGIALLPHLHGFWGPVVLLVVAVPFIATAFIAIGIVFAQLATAESRGVAMGMYSTVLFVGLGLGPAVFAPLIQGQGFAAGFTACAATGIVLSGLSLVARLEPVRRRLRETVVFPPTP